MKYITSTTVSVLVDQNELAGILPFLPLRFPNCWMQCGSSGKESLDFSRDMRRWDMSSSSLSQHPRYWKDYLLLILRGAKITVCTNCIYFVSAFEQKKVPPPSWWSTVNLEDTDHKPYHRKSALIDIKANTNSTASNGMQLVLWVGKLCIFSHSCQFYSLEVK